MILTQIFLAVHWIHSIFPNWLQHNCFPFSLESLLILEKPLLCLWFLPFRMKGPVVSLTWLSWGGYIRFVCLPLVAARVKYKLGFFTLLRVIMLFCRLDVIIPALLAVRKKVKKSESDSRSVVSDSATPWTVDRQASLSMEFFRQKYWRG